jgi:hypothetical protein
MKMQTIVIGIIIAVIAFYFIKTKFLNQIIEPDTDTKRPSVENLPTQEKKNDKLVIVNNITQSELDSILTGFCNMYNKESYQAQPRTFKLNERKYAIIFPFDIEFEIYCYFINYVHYPMGFDKSFEVMGWTTTKSGQNWITENTANKKVMLFIPTDDTEGDNVYLTTNDNIGYKLGFAMGEEKQLLSQPNRTFIAPNNELSELINKEQKDYK